MLLPEKKKIPLNPPFLRQAGDFKMHALVQAATIIGTLLGRFTVELATRMGGHEGVLERQIVAFTLAVDDGLWLKFVPRTGSMP